MSALPPDPPNPSPRSRALRARLLGLGLVRAADASPAPPDAGAASERDAPEDYASNDALTDDAPGSTPDPKEALVARLTRLGLVGGARRREVPSPRHAVPISLEVPGREVANSAGSYIENEVRVGLDHAHGNGSLRELLSLPPRLSGAAGKLPGYEAIDPARRVYLDTETTSLNSGAGVLVFLIGCGRLEGDTFVVRQFFMRHPGEERALLEGLRDHLNDLGALVSFHGKSFDRPRASDRFLFHGLSDLLRDVPHLDLYHAARRLLGHRGENCKLQTFERDILGFHRTQDLPGSECPAAYFAYVRGQGNRIAEVMEHNYFDILSLVRLEARLARSLAEPEDGEEALAAGLLAAYAGDESLARRLLIQGAATPPGPPREILAVNAALALRRLALPNEAVAVLRAHIVLGERPSPRVLDVLSATLERDLSDPEAALRVLMKGLGPRGDDAETEGVRSLRRRQHRLAKRLGHGVG